MIAPVSQRQQNRAPSFKSYNPDTLYNRVTDKFTDKIAHGVAKMHGKKNPGALIDWVNSNAKIGKYIHPIMLNLGSLAYTGMLITNTARSKKIEKDRKPMLMLNAALVTAISSTAAFIVDKKTDKFLEKIKDAYVVSHRMVNTEKIKQLEGSLKKVKSITLFTFIVRLIVPLLMVPITGSIVKNRKAGQKAEEAKAELKRFRQDNPKLMEEYDKLKALSKEVESSKPV